jgi:cobaltochelatase CobN
MHLLAAQQGRIDDGSAAVDLGQTPGDIIVLSAADSEIACLAAAQARLLAEDPAVPSLRLARLLSLRHNFSVDLYVETVVAKARLVVVRLLGGESYWPYGIERLASACARQGVALALLPGDDRADPDLMGRSTLPTARVHNLWGYLVEGGPGNAENFLRYCRFLVARGPEPRAAQPLLRAGLYWPGCAATLGLGDVAARWQAGRPVAAIVFYRALVQGDNLAAVDALIAALTVRGINPLPVHVASLKDAAAIALLEHFLDDARPELVLCTTAFAVSTPGRPTQPTPFDRLDCPVIQVGFAGSTQEAWESGSNGLDARDLAMNVVLPESDGRIFSRAVSFKAPRRRDLLTEADIVCYRPVPDRIAFVADLAAAWLELRRTPTGDRKLAFVLANYPNKDGRLGNGVGLDTSAGMIEILTALTAAGYGVEDAPEDGGALMRRLAAGPTNADPSRAAAVHLPLSRYLAFWNSLPDAVRAAVEARWGAPQSDRFFDPFCGFRLPVIVLGKVAIGLQPSRGYDIDPAASYHDPDLVPPHAYFAFYAWIRRDFGAHAVVHMGKHGTLEWLPGKSTALSGACLPEAVFGSTPQLYPFIVNDPGEGTQAKRRTAAVIVDHLTPPLTRAESYGPMARLEGLIDEYFHAAGLDPRRLALLSREIRDLAATSGLAADCGIGATVDDVAALTRIDAHLCDLKELQIRDGLHVFGRSPIGEQRLDLLVALARAPRGSAPEQASLIRALAADLALGFDPLDVPMAAPWSGPRPEVLAPGPLWRTAGDTVERLEALAKRIVGGAAVADPDWAATGAVLDWIATTLAPAIDGCGVAEMAGLLAGLGGRFVAPGPSGAPSRGRPEVLPTGRNFYSLDTRMVPTHAAWALGWRSACAIVERHVQDHGDYPKRVALSAWGTANMRTGGDDIAQALALLGVRPQWETVTGRVTGFEILPAGVLDRPRVDVTLRISGFFRDAFPELIDLVDSACRAVAALDEPEAVNPLAARVRADVAVLTSQGVAAAEAQRRAASRVFGSKPGAYGAGLQALIDEGGWRGEADFAAAYLAWGGWNYQAGGGNAAAHELFAERLRGVDAVIHNQDNREHDLLDSDDYYQFEGGLSAAVKHLSGARPVSYHNDHSRPERPVVRTLEEEIARVVRGRAANPKWIAGVKRHGYKGAFEIAATVDYLFAFAATTGAVRDHHFEALYQAYIEDAETDAFLNDHNPAARREIAARFREAIDRGLWQPRRNSVFAHLQEIAA